MAVPFDLFISYKSQNADESRAIAEALTANGLNVWFAEYNIPLDVYVADDLTAIEQALLDGIRRSRAALLMVSPQWYQSKYCQVEAEAIRAHLRDDSVFRLILSPSGEEAADPRFTGTARHDYTGVEDALSFLSRCLGRPLRLPRDESGPTCRVRISRNGHAAEVDAGRLLPEDAGFHSHLSGRIDGFDVAVSVPYFLPHRVTGGPPHYSQRELASKLRRIEESEHGGEYQDDRILYRDHARRALFACRTQNMNPVGVHLLHIEDRPGLARGPHFAVTVWDVRADNTRRVSVSRLYAIRVRDETTGRVGEVVLLATCLTQSTGVPHAVQGFVAITGRLDRMARSLDWKGDRDQLIRLRHSVARGLGVAEFVASSVVPAVLGWLVLPIDGAWTRALCGGLSGLLGWAGVRVLRMIVGSNRVRYEVVALVD